MTVEQRIQKAVEMTLDGVADKFERGIVRRYIKDLEAALNDQKAANALLMQSSNAISLTAKQQRQRAEAAETRLAIALGADKPDKPATAKERARHWALEAAAQKERADEAEAKYQFELQYRLALSRTVSAELKLLEKSQLRAEKWKARAEELEERNDTTPLDALKTVMEYSEFRGWANGEAVAAYRTLNDWLQFRK